ncbi:MAG: hypothetical protein K2Y29_06045 [Beijerinckiaceae bacterium]|nr:hypothetical protein [Beijerinckiaceae bacterium]
MMEFISALISFFLTGPLQTELNEKLAAARVPQAIVTQVTDCAREAAPALIGRALSDPWWATTSSMGVWAGYSRPEAILAEAAPACRPALEAARPFLAAAAAS